MILFVEKLSTKILTCVNIQQLFKMKKVKKNCFTIWTVGKVGKESLLTVRPLGKLIRPKLLSLSC